MIKVSVTKLADNTKQVAQAIKVLSDNEVLVGVPSSQAGRRDLEINNAALAYIHEHGAPEANIPPRPFMKPGVNEVKDRLKSALKKAGDIALRGKPEEVIRQYHRIGMIARDAIKRKITTGPFTPLRPSTIKARRRRGRTGTKPLLDTGQMRNAINYVIARRQGWKKQ